MPYCDNCGSPTGLNDRNFTQGGGALCNNCRQINRVYVLAELSIDLRGRDVEEVLTYLQAPINLQGLFDVQPSLIAYHVVRNGEPQRRRPWSASARW